MKLNLNKTVKLLTLCLPLISGFSFAGIKLSGPDLDPLFSKPSIEPTPNINSLTEVQQNISPVHIQQTESDAHIKVTYPSYLNHHNYYTSHLYSFTSLGPNQLRSYLRSILNYPHLRRSGLPDQLVSSCAPNMTNCFPVKAFRYEDARKILFGKIHMRPLENNSGTKAIEPLYCGAAVTHSSIKPFEIPYGSGLNCEHIWPKSRFGLPKNTPDYNVMKSDLHHLYPSIATVNSERGSNRFGHPTKPQRVKHCSQSLKGPGAYGMLFLPREKVRGDVARAIFYFAIRFGVPIDDREEQVLRAWHLKDPVSDFEIYKNNLVYSSQGNRNPFIDFPNLIDYLPNL